MALMTGTYRGFGGNTGLNVMPKKVKLPGSEDGSATAKQPKADMEEPDISKSFTEIAPTGSSQRFDALTQDLAGQLRSRNDAAANQAIASSARRMGGNVSSPAFSLLAQTATTGAAGQTGADMGQLRLSAAETAEGMDLQRQLANQQARLQAQNMANQFALNRQSQANQWMQGQQQLDLSRSGQDLQKAQLGLQYGGPSETNALRSNIISWLS